MNFSQLDAEFSQLLSIFETIATYSSSLQRRYLLNRVAPCYRISTAEFRKLFELWLITQLDGGEE